MRFCSAFNFMRIHDIKKGITLIYRKPLSWIVHFFATLTVLLFIIWLPNLHFLFSLLQNRTVSFLNWLKIVFTSFQSLQFSIPLLDAISGVIIALLFGMQISGTIYLLRERLQSHRTMGIGGFGLIIGMVGIGCSACGSVLLTSLIGLGTATFFLQRLPFHGSELSFLGILFLCISIALTAKQIGSPPTCVVKIEKAD